MMLNLSWWLRVVVRIGGGLRIKVGGIKGVLGGRIPKELGPSIGVEVWEIFDQGGNGSKPIVEDHMELGGMIASLDI